MSIEWIFSSCVLIILVVLLRFVLRKRLRPCVRYALWLGVMLRLLLPFSFWETTVSVLNLLPERSAVKAEESNVALKTGEGEGWQGQEDAVMQTELELSVNTGLPSDPESALSIDPALSAVTVLPADTNLSAPPLEELRGAKTKSNLLLCAWLLGAAVWGVILLAVNWDYGRRLELSRRKVAGEKLPRESQIPVYTSKVIETPCLFGLLHPGIYVTEQVLEDSKLCGFVLDHENIHYRHHDNWWALVRACCLCLHWYNPLVWLAAYLSRQDGELACDEKVLDNIGRKEQGEYGRALLALSTGELSGIGRWRISTAMGTTLGGGKRQLRERLQMIVKTPKENVGVQLTLSVLAIFLLVATFTGKSSGEHSLQDIISLYEEKAASETTLMSDIGQGVDSSEQEQEAENSAKWQAVLTSAEAETEEETDLLAEQPEHLNLREEEQRAYQQILKGEGAYPANTPIRADDVRAVDLNFDGWEDLCIQGRSADGLNVPCYCMLWKPQKQKFEYSVTLCNVETDLENQWIVSRVVGTEGESFRTYCRYDAEDQLHMIKYVEESKAGDGFEHLDLTYVDDAGPYTLQAIVDEERFNLTLVEMARQALLELYQWTGEKVETACFQVSDMGGVVFSLTEEDMEHSRIFFSRYYGADTQYNLSGYDKSISSIGVASGRRVWFSPVLWRVFPKNMEDMTDEEVISWYFERIPISEEEGVKTIEQRFENEDIWTIQAKSGRWFEVFYNRELREVSDVTGPYPEIPVH